MATNPNYTAEIREIERATNELSNDRGTLEEDKKAIVGLLARSKVENSSRDSKSRSKIAFLFSIAFVMIVGALIIGGPIFNNVVDDESKIDILELLESFCSHFGIPLGFVLGYYFKTKGE